MSHFVSKDGVWHPAKEHVVLPHLTGTKNEVYDGPDRAAEFELAQAYGVDEDGKPKEVTFGMDFRKDPELINRARQMGFNSVDEYAKAAGYDPEVSEKKFKKLAAQIIKHKDPDRKPEKLIIGGGIDTSGKGGDLIGGLGDERERPAKELL